MKRREFAASMIAAGAAAALPRTARGLTSSAAPLRVNGARLNAHLAALAEFGKNPQGGVSRVAYTDADKASRPYIMQLMREARLDVSVDAAGNMHGRRAGSDASLKPILFGSHTDSVPEGGMYDGDVGSMGAIEVAQSLAEQNVTTRHPIDVVIWQNEEGGVVGKPRRHRRADARRAGDGEPQREDHPRGDRLPRRRSRSPRAHAAREGERRRVPRTAHRAGRYARAGKARHRRRRGDRRHPSMERHDRGVPEPRRHDRDGRPAGRAAFRGALHRGGQSHRDGRARTPGRDGGAHRGVPRRAERHPRHGSSARSNSATSTRRRSTRCSRRSRRKRRRIGAKNGTTFTFALFTDNVPAPTAPAIRAMIAASAGELGLTHRTMPSGAGHDAQDLAQICPVGMIFIPSIGGISHAPKEYLPSNGHHQWCERPAEHVAQARRRAVAVTTTGTAEASVLRRGHIPIETGGASRAAGPSTRQAERRPRALECSPVASSDATRGRSRGSGD